MKLVAASFLILVSATTFGQSFARSVSFGKENVPLGIVDHADGPNASRVMQSGPLDKVTHTAADLGVPTTGDVVGISDGNDDVTENGPASSTVGDMAERWVAVEFTVHHGSQGLSGTPIRTDWGTSGPANLAATYWVSIEDGIVNPVEVVEGPSLPEGVAIDALSTIMTEDIYPVYMALSPESVAELLLTDDLPEGATASCLFVKLDATSPLELFKWYEDLGLDCEDEIDALAYDAIDEHIAFSLKSSSPTITGSSGVYSGATIFINTGGTTLIVWAEPDELGLRDEDDLSGLIILDPLDPEFARGETQFEGGTAPMYWQATMLVNDQDGSVFSRVFVDKTEQITVTLRPKYPSLAALLVHLSIPSTNEGGEYGGIELIFDPMDSVYLLASTLDPGSAPTIPGIYYSLPIIDGDQGDPYELVLGAPTSGATFTLQAMYWADYTPENTTDGEEWRSSNAIVVCPR